MKSEKIGIVTVLYKSEIVLDDFFNTLNEQSYKNFTLYVIDNKSPDNSLEKSKMLAKSVWFETKFIENDDNYGVAKGNNQGIEAALQDDCDYVLLSNNDVVLRPETIEKLFTGLKENNVDMAVPKIYFYGTNKIWAAGGKFTWYNGSAKHFGYNKNDNGYFNRNSIIDYSPTCFMLIKKEVFCTVGMMDEKYFVYYDDTDFLYRSKNKNKKVMYIFNSILEHKESTSTGNRSDFTIYFNIRNRIYFSKKYRRDFLLFYYINIIYHFSIRRIKMFKNKNQWQLMIKAMKDGFLL